MKPVITVISTQVLEPEQTELLIRIAAPQVVPSVPPALDLVLALDTSGSMRGLPLELARQAAEQVYIQRGDTRLGLVHFNSAAYVGAPLHAWGEEGDFLQALGNLHAAGSTALHAGWQLAVSMLTSSVMQEPHSARRMQRVLLLTDGQANVGLRRPAELGAEIRRGLLQGVSTSTVGVGPRYDEQLLETLAGEGDGNYHYAETPEQLSSLFLDELESLKSTFGHLVSLDISGVASIELLNDLPQLPNGRYALPPLQSGRSLDLLLRVKADGQGPLRLRLAWTGLDGVRQRNRLEVNLQDFNSATALQKAEMTQLRASLMLARQQRQLAQLADQGNVPAALLRLDEAQTQLQALQQQGMDVGNEMQQLRRLRQQLQRGERQAASKLARSDSYLTSSGRKKQ